jgi:hypothetical protein
MKRKESTLQNENSTAIEDSLERKVTSITEAVRSTQEQTTFLIEDGKLAPFSPADYTRSTVYQAAESYSVECKLVRPEEPSNLSFEGKKPSKKTVPAVVLKNGECILLSSWEELESKPEQLADAKEVIGVEPVKQIFVLKRK